MRSQRCTRLVPILIATLLLAVSAKAKSCLWKAAAEQGTIYLQGSVHLLKADDYPLDPVIENAYTQSDTLVFEVDITEMLSPETQQLILHKALLPGDRTLESELDSETYAWLTRKLSESGLPPVAVQKFKPWFATLTLMMTKMKSMGLDPHLGLDQYLHRKARLDGKAVVGLETVEFQINLFDALSDGNQNGYTRHALKELEQMETMLNDMLQSWKTGDIDKLDKLMWDSFAEYPDMYEKFVTDRNKTWLVRLNELAHKEKTCMVVVGVAHLAGKEGLLELLKAEGYSIEQL